MRQEREKWRLKRSSHVKIQGGSLGQNMWIFYGESGIYVDFKWMYIYIYGLKVTNISKYGIIYGFHMVKIPQQWLIC